MRKLTKLILPIFILFVLYLAYGISFASKEEVESSGEDLKMKEIKNGYMMTDSTAYSTNGETIFRTGRNKDGKIVQDLENSMMSMMVMGCANCHGSDGQGGMMMMGRTVPSIRYSDLTDSAKHTVPYNDSLLLRFLDHELKSDGTEAQTGVVWKMSDKDKADLIEFLKTLQNNKNKNIEKDKMRMPMKCPMMR